jgi:hypothetical protein
MRTRARRPWWRYNSNITWKNSRGTFYRSRGAPRSADNALVPSPRGGATSNLAPSQPAGLFLVSSVTGQRWPRAGGSTRPPPNGRSGRPETASADARSHVGHTGPWQQERRPLPVAGSICPLQGDRTVAPLLRAPAGFFSSYGSLTWSTSPPRAGEPFAGDRVDPRHTLPVS